MRNNMQILHMLDLLIQSCERVAGGGLVQLAQSVNEQPRNDKERTRRIVAVSNISAMNVETPLSWLSPAPIRQRMESKMGISASPHGMKEPICAIREMTPV
jgi:hypothetical protein